MKLGNIDRLLLFRAEGGNELTIGQLADKYQIPFDGTNLYFGVNDFNVASFKDSGRALNPTDDSFIDGFIDALAASELDEMTLNLGIEPSAPTSFDFVAANSPMIKALASELHTKQKNALDRGKRMQIVVRYASEMNSDDNVWGKRPADFIKSYQSVRAIFGELAPNVLFAFSPALRADIDESVISDYWPGTDLVDVISSTWYVHGEAQFAQSVATMRAYYLHRLDAHKPFGFCELSGADDSWKQTDTFINRMLHAAEALQIQNVSFNYATLFLEKPWGSDTTLAFLK